MTKPFIIRDGDRSIDDLAALLRNGWHVVHSCPMPSSCAASATIGARDYRPTCLVILDDQPPLICIPCPGEIKQP